MTSLCYTGQPVNRPLIDVNSESSAQSRNNTTYEYIPTRGASLYYDNNSVLQPSQLVLPYRII